MRRGVRFNTLNKIRRLTQINADKITFARLITQNRRYYFMKTFTAVVERDLDTNLYVGYVPGFKGAHSQGETIEELTENLIIKLFVSYYKLVTIF